MPIQSSGYIGCSMTTGAYLCHYELEPRHRKGEGSGTPVTTWKWTGLGDDCTSGDITQVTHRVGCLNVGTGSQRM